MSKGLHKQIISWYGRDFVLLSAEGSGGFEARAETRRLLTSFLEELKSAGLSLENTVRTRLWAKESESRNLGAQERLSILSGAARSASSSYIAPEYFVSEALIALDLLAMKPTRPDAQKVLKEHVPPRVPLRSLIYDSFVFLSGVVAVRPTLSEQLDEIVRLITGSLQDAGSGWEHVIETAFYFQRQESLDELRTQFEQLVTTDIPQMVYVPVDGYSKAGMLLEVEVTALRPDQK